MYAHLAWAITPRKQGGLGELNIPILSDKNHNISKLYGVLDAKEGISQKALFVIDKKQLIRYIMINEICTARSVDETLRIVEGCKFVDEFGATCPAGPRDKLNDEMNYFSAWFRRNSNTFYYVFYNFLLIISRWKNVVFFFYIFSLLHDYLALLFKLWN